MNKSKYILSCDWGTSSFRLRLVDIEKMKVLHEISTNEGVNAIHNEWIAIRKPENVRANFYRSFIQSNVEKMPVAIVKDVRVIISGMASSTIGMKELSYANAPFNLSGENLITDHFVADEFCKHPILLVSGLQTKNDVMRGEETILIGCDLSDEETLVIFPGTHSKHVVVKNKIAVDFKTYITGEFFDLLSTKSLLAKSVVKNVMSDNKSFIEGVKDGAKNNVLNASFHVRTNQLFKKYSAEENYHHLSGLLIGNEVSAICCQSVIIVADDVLMDLYTSALSTINPNIKIHQQNANEALIKAHVCIYNNK